MSKSKQNLIEDYLNSEPLFRERKNKDRGIVNLIINLYGLHSTIQRGEITKDRIVSLVQDYASMDRMWRRTLEENPTLRGKDYDDKDQLEAKKMSLLGYYPKSMGPFEVGEKETQSTLL